ncbi:MAG TPA: phospholipid carrier-dependent glycosyltransferase [Actinomycetota bacterium]|nr:phospholipid carrier-dependent glycosyltransferase [Actinomycetota bacterium]
MSGSYDFPAAPDEADELQVRGTRAERHRAQGPSKARAWVVIGLVTLLAGGLRLWHLSSPHAYVFDEVYYAKDACFDAGYPYKKCGLSSPGEQTITVHPPLGRWIIAGGEAAFGNRPFGWRIASAIFGTISVTLLAILALQLFRSVLWAGVAGLLLATETLNLVQSRVAMLDIFVTAFVVAGILFLVLDRSWMQARTPEAAAPEVGDMLGLPPDRVPSPLFRPWRVAAGIALGASMATKWSGALALVAALLLTCAWEWGRRHRARLVHPVRQAVRDESFGIILFLIVVPLAVYLASYARWWVDHGTDFSGWLHLQRSMLEYSIHLRATHPYASPAWKWLFLMRPVSYYYQCTHATGTAACARSAEILGLGNPLIFWATFITMPYLVIRGWQRRDWVAGLIVTVFAVSYFPWFLVARTSFLFYMAPITPFMVLALVYAIRDLARVPVGVKGGSMAPASFAVVVISVALCIFFYPILVGHSIAQVQWQHRIWFNGTGLFHLWNWV